MPTKRHVAPEERPKRTVKPRMSVPRPVSRPTRAPRRSVVVKKTAVSKKVVAPIAPAETPVMVQPNEKRSLILAHAAMRKPRDPVQMMSLWAGVAATFVVVVGAWYWASKPVYLKAFTRPVDSGLEFVQQDAAVLGQQVGQISTNGSQKLYNDVADTAARLNALNAQVQNNQEALNRVAAMVSSSTPAQTQLFQPTSPTTTHISD